MFHFSLVLACTLTHWFLLQATCTEAKALPDDAAAEAIGRQAAKAASAGGRSESSETSDMFVDDGFGDALTKALSRVPNPRDVSGPASRIRYLDPDLLGHPDSCDRYYSVACPQDFSIREVKENLFSCIPKPQYRGPCQEMVTFSNDVSDVETKRSFASRCRTNWACRDCLRDFRQPCPENFRLNDANLCVPTANYHGTCRDPVSFWMHNAEMISQWMIRCMAYFPCVPPAEPRQTSMSLSAAASLKRVVPSS